MCYTSGGKKDWSIKLLKGVKRFQRTILNTESVETVRISMLRHLLYRFIILIHFNKLNWVSIANVLFDFSEFEVVRESSFGHNVTCE